MERTIQQLVISVHDLRFHPVLKGTELQQLHERVAELEARTVAGPDLHKQAEDHEERQGDETLTAVQMPQDSELDVFRRELREVKDMLAKPNVISNNIFSQPQVSQQPVQEASVNALVPQQHRSRNRGLVFGKQRMQRS